MNETKTGWNQAMLTGGQEGLAQLHWGIVIFVFLKVRSRVWLDLHKEEKVSFETF